MCGFLMIFIYYCCNFVAFCCFNNEAPLFCLWLLVNVSSIDPLGNN